VQFVYEQNNLALRIGYLFQERFQPIFEFATKLCAGHHRANVHCNNALLFE
jgi:hypothetical protein